MGLLGRARMILLGRLGLSGPLGVLVLGCGGGEALEDVWEDDGYMCVCVWMLVWNIVKYEQILTPTSLACD